MAKKLITILSIVTIIASLSVIFFFNLQKFKDENGFQLLESQTFFPGKNKLPESLDQVSLIAVGDIMLSRNVAQKMKVNGYEYPFSETKGYLQNGDIVFGNLETSITPGRDIKTGETTFRADVETARMLKAVGFDIVSLANNHTPNFGQEGLNNTFKYLTEADIKYVGAGKNYDEAYAPAYFKHSGITFAFFAYNDTDVVPASYGAGENHGGTAFMDIEKMQAAVKKAKLTNDFVIVSMHSGTEYTEKQNKRQTEFAHASIDAGADMVIGHHPHVIQHAEVYKGKYIFYSLGNFVFDQMWSQATREGITLKISFTKKGITKIEFTPVLIEDYSKPKILTGEDGQKLLNILDLPLDGKNFIILP